MSKFEVLCVTMHQKDFSKIEEMNIHSDIMFANQADETCFKELDFDGHRARMITTDTRGVGVNRNLALLYADGDICLFADDDVTYYDDLEEKILSEFNAHPDADIIIFNLDADSDRKPVKYKRTKKFRGYGRMPWGAVRIAFRRDKIKKENICFTTLFGGGCIFPSGEDSVWVNEAKRKGMTFYVSKEIIGKISFDESSWFTGYDHKFFYGKGAFCAHVHPAFTFVWLMYYALRYKSHKEMTVTEKLLWMKHGTRGYREMLSYNDYIKKHNL